MWSSGGCYRRQANRGDYRSAFRQGGKETGKRCSFGIVAQRWWKRGYRRSAHTRADIEEFLNYGFFYKFKNYLCMNSPVKIWRNQKKLTKLLQKHGRIISWAIIRMPAADFVSQAPYPVVIVTLDNGRTIVAQLVDWEDKNLQVGQKVKTVVRKITDVGTEGIIRYVVKVKPI